MTAGPLHVLLKDPAVTWLALARVTQYLTAPLVLWLCLVRLSDEGRALYGIVANLALLGSVFELGPGTLLVQITTHVPVAALRRLTGEAAIWYLRIAGFTLLSLLSTGLLILRPKFAPFDASFPFAWVTLSLLVAGYLPLIPAIVVREGSGGTIAVQQMRALQAVVSSSITLISLAAGQPLLAAVSIAATQLIIAAGFLRQTGSHSVGNSMEGVEPFRRERMRSLLLWLTLWVTPQVVTPAVVVGVGAAAAGPMAIGMALALAPLMISIAWLHGRYATLGTLVAEGKLTALDRVTSEATRHAMLLFLLLAMGTICIPILMNSWDPLLTTRILPISGLLLLLIAHMAMLLIQAMLAWARAFGEESLAGPAQASCLLMALGASNGAAINGASGAAAGYALGAITGLGIVIASFNILRGKKAVRF